MKSELLRVGGALGLLTILSAAPAEAHHSFAMFDFSKDVSIRGTIREFRWTNPHIRILIDVPDTNGQVRTYDIEGSTPNSLRPRGWSSTTLTLGETISLVIHPLKNGTPGGSFVSASRADGTPIGPRPAPAPGGAAQ